MTKFFQKNIALLKKHSSFAKHLSEPLPASIEVQSTSSGKNTIRLNNILIHSMYDPVKEGQTFAKKIKVGSQVCLYGFGLGYHIDPILEKIGSSGFLLAIELNTDLLLAAMILRNQSEILNDDRFHIVYGLNEEIVSNEISKYMEKMQNAKRRKIN